jgi:hypothetical protein
MPVVDRWIPWIALDLSTNGIEETSPIALSLQSTMMDAYCESLDWNKYEIDLLTERNGTITPIQWLSTADARTFGYLILDLQPFG